VHRLFVQPDEDREAENQGDHTDRQSPRQALSADTQEQAGQQPQADDRHPRGVERERLAGHREHRPPELIGEWAELAVHLVVQRVALVEQPDPAAEIARVVVCRELLEHRPVGDQGAADEDHPI
jgi:hypothetical protein